MDNSPISSFASLDFCHDNRDESHPPCIRHVTIICEFLPVPTELVDSCLCVVLADPRLPSSCVCIARGSIFRPRKSSLLSYIRKDSAYCALSHIEHSVILARALAKQDPVIAGLASHHGRIPQSESNSRQVTEGTPVFPTPVTAEKVHVRQILLAEGNLDGSGVPVLKNAVILAEERKDCSAQLTDHDYLPEMTEDSLLRPGSARFGPHMLFALSH